MHNRTEERALLARKLENGVNIHMPAPRRIGKSWTVARLAEDLRAKDWQVIELDVEGRSTVQKFAEDLCHRIEAEVTLKDRLLAHAQQRLRNLLGSKGGDKLLDALNQADPEAFAETLIESLDATGRKTAILVDEIAYFVLALAEADAKAAQEFVYRLRNWQQRFRNVRWLLTGSIGLDLVARRYHLEGAFVDLEIFILEPFTPEQARSFLRDPNIQRILNRPFDASDADFDRMFAELGWLSPFYLHAVANEVLPSGHGSGSAPPLATWTDIEQAFEKMLHPLRRTAFSVWGDHLRKNLPPEESARARRLLTALAAHPDGETMATLVAVARQGEPAASEVDVRESLYALDNEGLVIRRGDRYAFRSGLVRRYWQTYEVR